MMSIDTELLEEFKSSLVDKYTPIELAELFIDHFDLSEWDILDLMGDDRITEIKFR